MKKNEAFLVDPKNIEFSKRELLDFSITHLDKHSNVTHHMHTNVNDDSDSDKDASERN
ncbi:MAG: hypothetical protein RR593_00630 [Hungatella sp.]